MTPPIYFARHGQTEWNAIERFQGQAEADLTPLGRSQAAANGALLKRLVADPSAYAFVASPMRRTRETMEIARAAMGLDPKAYLLEPRLIEVNFGDWQGYTADELERSRPGLLALRDKDKWNYVPSGAGAESYAVLARRVAGWLDRFSGPAVVVTHGGVIRSLFHIVNKLPDVEAATMDVPQDRVLSLSEGRLEWISPE